MLVLFVILGLAVAGSLPTWRYSRHWGYYPSGALGLALLVFFILYLTGEI